MGHSHDVHSSRHREWAGRERHQILLKAIGGDNVRLEDVCDTIAYCYASAPLADIELENVARWHERGAAMLVAVSHLPEMLTPELIETMTDSGMMTQGCTPTERERLEAEAVESVLQFLRRFKHDPSFRRMVRMFTGMNDRGVETRYWIDDNGEPHGDQTGLHVHAQQRGRDS